MTRLAATANGFGKKSTTQDNSSVSCSNNQSQANVTINKMDSPVKQMFTGRSVFITGASGFIGRVLLEKLLRCYPGIKSVYILMRQKKNQNPHDRLHKQLLNVPLFDKIRAQKDGPELLDKIVVIPGDIADSWLGISDSDLERLFSDPSLSIVFHSAATIKFDEPLRVSVKLNLIATRTVIEFCRRLPNLISFCHVSTCYTNSDILDGQSIIEEKVYPMSDDPKTLMQLADILEDDLMQNLKHTVIKRRPNTYTYTKALAEKYISAEATDLPVAIVRPSIVVAAWKDPMPGWVDNINGPTGLLLAIGKGLLRSVYCIKDSKADMIPVDIVVNAMIASAYYSARVYNKFQPISSDSNEEPPTLTNGNHQPSNISVNNNNNNHTNDSCRHQTQQVIQESTKIGQLANNESTTEAALATIPKPPIFQVNSGDLNPLTWRDMESFCMPILRKYPSCQVLRYPNGTFKSSPWFDLFMRIFVHYLPALFLDTICLLTGKKRQLLSIYQKLDSAIAALTHFLTHNYNFRTANLPKLREFLDGKDRDELFLDIENLDWHDFWDTYVLGCRRYVLRESDDSLEEARKSFKKSHQIELAFRAGLVLLLLVFVGLIFYSQTSSLSSSESCVTSSADDASDSLDGGRNSNIAGSVTGTCYNQSALSFGHILNIF